MIKAKWFIYTVLIGILPFLLRLFIYFVSAKSNIEFIMNESDFIVFGLVLNLTNLNELENKETSLWKTQVIGIATIQVIIYSGILVASYITELPGDAVIDSTILFYCSLFLSVCSFLFSYSIYDKLSKIQLANEHS